jgi:hypothetical protein
MDHRDDARWFAVAVSTGPDASPDGPAGLTLADHEPWLLIPAQDFHHGEQRPRDAMQYYRRSAVSQPDDSPQPGKVTERHSGQVDMETSAVPGNTAQRLYQSGIGFIVDVATQGERVVDLAVHEEAAS